MTEPSRAPEQAAPNAIPREVARAIQRVTGLAFERGKQFARGETGDSGDGLSELRAVLLAWNRRSATPASPAAPKQWENIRAVAWRIYEMAKAQGDTDQRAVERVAEAVGSLQMPLPLTAGRVMAALMACGTKDVKRLTEVLNANVLALSPSSPREPSEAAWIRPAIHCDTEARPISQKTVTEYRCVVCGDHFVGDSGYRAIDFPPSGGTT